MLQLLLQLAEMLGLRRARPGGTETSLERLLEEQKKLNYCCTYLEKKKNDHINSARQVCSREERLRLARKIKGLQRGIDSHAGLMANLDRTIQALLFARVSSSYASSMRQATQDMDTTTLTEDVERAQENMSDIVADLDEIATVLGTDDNADDEEALLLLLESQQNEPDNEYIRASLFPSVPSHEPGRGIFSVLRDTSDHAVSGNSGESTRTYQLDNS